MNSVWKIKGKGFPHFIPSIGPRADPSVQAVSQQVTVSHPPGGRLLLLFARVTFPAAEHHRPLAGTKLYCLMTKAHRCEQLAQGCYAAFPRAGFDPAAYWSQVQRYTSCTTGPPGTLNHEGRTSGVKSCGWWRWTKWVGIIEFDRHVLHAALTKVDLTWWTVVEMVVDTVTCCQ